MYKQLYNLNMKNKTLRISKAKGVTEVIIDNLPVNIISIDLIHEVNFLLESLKEDKDSKIIIFKSANEKFFSAHLDLNIINGTPEGQAGSIEFNKMIKNIKSLKQLSIAFVDGIARGGGNEFVMACDLSYGTENAIFAQPELGVNIPTGGQGAVQFARRMGTGKSLQALLLGLDFNAKQAETLNIITQYVPKKDSQNFLNNIISAINNLELRDIIMYKEIIKNSIIDEDKGSELELNFFLERAKEEKTQNIFNAFLKHGGQTEREASDFAGLFADTAIELSK